MTGSVMSHLEKLLLCILIGFAIVAGYYVHSISSRFEVELSKQSENQNHEVAKMVATLGSLEDDIRALNFGNQRKGLELVQASFEKARTLIEDTSRSHNYEPQVPQTRALQIAMPLIQDLSHWLDSGINDRAPQSAIVQRIASQRVYLARVQLENISQSASDQTLDLLNNQSAQLRSFGRTVILLLAGLAGLLVVAGLLYHRNRQAQETLWRQRKMVSDSINNINEGFILTDASGKVLVVNAALLNMCPSLASELESDDLYDNALNSVIDNTKLTEVRTHSADLLLEDQQSANSSPGEQNVYLTDSGLFLRVTERDTVDGGRVITFTDITDLKNTEDKLQRQANYDYLTGIANRSHYVQKLKEAIARAKRHNHKVALMQFDLDRFKQVNDTLGHAVGDELLIQTAARIKRNLREVDLAARVGGDEFAAIIDQISDQKEAITSAERIINELYQEFEFAGIQVDFSASIGIAIFPDHADDINSLMQHADIACYRAKESGRNNVQMYGTDMKVQALKQMTLESRLRRAIDQNNLSIAYQPHMNLETGKLTAVEAFSRWQDGFLGDVPPSNFIPVADKNGLITKLGEQMLSKVFAQLQSWQQQGLEDMQVAINISQRQLLQPNLPDIIDQLSADFAVDPGNIMFEITESVITQDAGAASQQLHTLAERNIKFVLDDYGKGNSSLHSITKLPIQALKIDGAFIDKLTVDQATRDIVGAMVSSAQSLHLDTIAENVETEAQVDILRDIGCTIIQGFYVGQPQTPEQIVLSYQSHIAHGQARKQA